MNVCKDLYYYIFYNINIFFCHGHTFWYSWGCSRGPWPCEFGMLYSVRIGVELFFYSRTLQRNWLNFLSKKTINQIDINIIIRFEFLLKNAKFWDLFELSTCVLTLSKSIRSLTRILLTYNVNFISWFFLTIVGFTFLG